MANKVWLIGRLTKNPDVRYTDGGMCIARYTLAVDRRGKDKGADFISCIAFGKGGEFAEKYLRKGAKIAVTGRIQTGSYENREGQKIFTTDVVVEDHEFCESKQSKAEQKHEETVDGWTRIADNVDIEEELPFD